MIIVLLEYVFVQNYVGQVDVSSWAPYVSVLASRAAQIALHYNGLHVAYEIWNEQDLQQTYVPPQIYAFLLRQVYAAIKQSSPSSVVVLGGLASGDPQYVAQVAEAEGGIVYADAIGLHPYGQVALTLFPVHISGVE